MDKAQLKQRVVEIWFAKLANCELRYKYWESAGNHRACAIVKNEWVRLTGALRDIEGDVWGFGKLLVASRSSRL